MSEITTYTEAGVMTVTLDRAAKKNALTKAMYAGLSAALAEATADDAVRAVVITASGGDFCAGNDIMDFAQDLPTYADEAADHDGLPVFQFLKALAYFEKPLIAAVQGQAVGVGVTLLLHCDLVVVADDVRLTLPFLKLGLVPEAGSTVLLPERIGHARAFAWMALGEAVGADQAVTLGLANRAVPREELATAAQDMALKLASLSPSAVRQTKGLMRDPDALWQVIRREGVLFRQQLLKPETQAAFAAFLSR